MTNSYQKLRKLVHSINHPDGHPLVFGSYAIIKNWWPGRIYMTSENNIRFESMDQNNAICVSRTEDTIEENLGPDITLQDILLALDKNKVDNYIKIESDCWWWRDLILWLEDDPDFDEDKCMIPIDLSKPIKEQDEEVLQSIYNLLDNQND